MSENEKEISSIREVNDNRAREFNKEIVELKEQLEKIMETHGLHLGRTEDIKKVLRELSLCTYNLHQAIINNLSLEELTIGKSLFKLYEKLDGETPPKTCPTCDFGKYLRITNANCYTCVHKSNWKPKDPPDNQTKTIFHITHCPKCDSRVEIKCRDYISAPIEADRQTDCEYWDKGHKIMNCRNCKTPNQEYCKKFYEKESPEDIVGEDKG